MTIEESKRILPPHLQNSLCLVAQISTQANGPVRARDFLPRHGIGMEYVMHLPRTHLDGAVPRPPGSRR